MIRALSAIGLLALAASVSGEAVLLDEAAFKEAIGSGTNYFVKFFAPWCGHCKRLKPDWDKLAAEFSESKSVEIADVDCTVETDLCSEYGVSGYPTLKYFTAETGSEGAAYNGNRGYDDLQEFVTENLSVKCTVEDREGCSDKENKFIDTMKAKGDDAIKGQIKRLEGMKDKPMKPELGAWLRTRLRLLNELSADDKEEL